jgi:hypothetical protein
MSICCSISLDCEINEKYSSVNNPIFSSKEIPSSSSSAKPTYLPGVKTKLFFSIS